MLLKESRERFSYLHPDRSKFITDRSLGALYKTDSIFKTVAKNAEARQHKKPGIKHMAETLIYIEEHGYDTREILENKIQMHILHFTSSIYLSSNLQ